MDASIHLFYINAMHRENHHDAYVNFMLRSNADPWAHRISVIGAVLRLKLGALVMSAGEAIRPEPAADEGNRLAGGVEASGAAVGTNVK